MPTRRLTSKPSNDQMSKHATRRMDCWTDGPTQGATVVRADGLDIFYHDLHAVEHGLWTNDSDCSDCRDKIAVVVTRWPTVVIRAMTSRWVKSAKCRHWRLVFRDNKGRRRYRRVSQAMCWLRCVQLESQLGVYVASRSRRYYTKGRESEH